MVERDTKIKVHVFGRALCFGRRFGRLGSSRGPSRASVPLKALFPTSRARRFSETKQRKCLQIGRLLRDGRPLRGGPSDLLSGRLVLPLSLGARRETRDGPDADGRTAPLRPTITAPPRVNVPLFVFRSPRSISTLGAGRSSSLLRPCASDRKSLYRRPPFSV
jgi:hypothetical protein